MLHDINIESILKNHILNPSFVLDEKLEIIEMNELGKSLLNAESNSSFFDYFHSSTVQFLERIILESTNYDKPVTELIKIQIKNQTVKRETEVHVTPYYFEKKSYYLVTLREKDYELASEKIKFHILTENFESLLKESKIKNLYDEIIKSYPFTFIEKQAIQKKIDKFTNICWLKNTEGKYLFVNKVFADLYGIKSTQIEGKLEKQILPEHLGEFFQFIDNFILQSANSVVLSGMDKIFDSKSDIKKEFVQIPILDMDGNPVAILGFSSDIELQAESEETSNFDLLDMGVKITPGKMILTDLNFIVLSASDAIKEYLNLDQNVSTGIHLNQFLGKELWTKIHFHLEGETSPDGKSIKHQVRDKNGDLKKINITLNRIKSSQNEILGYSLYFEDISEPLAESASADLSKILKNIPEPLFIYELENLKFIEVNESALALYGYTQDEFLKMDLTDLYAPEDIQTLLETTSNDDNLGRFSGPWRHRSHSGNAILVELSSTKIDYKGQKAHLNIIRDVSSKSSDEKQIQLFKAAFDHSNDLIFITDKDGFITYANKNVNDTLGFFDSELEERPFLSLLSDADRAKVNTNIFHAGINEVESLEIELKNSEGDFIAANLIATPIFNYKKEIDSFNIILKLIPKNTDDFVQKTSRQAENKSEIDSSFLSNLFHELLTPINVIVGFVQELTESIEKPTPEQKESTEIILENQKLLLQTMNTAIEYSQIEQKQVKLIPEKMVFVDLLEELEGSTKKIAESREVSLSYSKISSSLNFISDKQRFTTLMNLFVRFSILMTQEKTVLLSAYHFEDNFIVTIKDKRDGITSNLLKNLRELFTADEDMIRNSFRSSRFTIRLLRKLVELLAIKREVIVKMNDPFEFGIIFPMELKVSDAPKLKIEEKSNTEEDIVKSEKITNKENKTEVKSDLIETQKKEVADDKLTPAEQQEAEIDFSQLSCLYVEDQVDSQILFKVQMKELKSIDFTTSFEKAIPLLKSKSFNFIVLDINLQGEYNGLDALKIIRKMPVYEDIPIVAVSAYVLPGDKERFVEAGFDDFISKPVLRDKLYTSLKQIYGSIGVV